MYTYDFRTIIEKDSIGHIQCKGGEPGCPVTYRVASTLGFLPGQTEDFSNGDTYNDRLYTIRAVMASGKNTTDCNSREINTKLIVSLLL